MITFVHSPATKYELVIENTGKPPFFFLAGLVASFEVEAISPSELIDTSPRRHERAAPQPQTNLYYTSYSISDNFL